MKPIKLKVFIPTNPNKNIGGIEEIFKQLAEYLKINGINLNFIYPKKSKNLFLGKYHAFPNPKINVNKDELVLVTGHLTLYSIFSIFLLSLRKAKVHYFPFWHNPVLHAKNKPIKKIFMLFFDKLFLKLALKNCYRIWYLSTYEKNNLIKLHNDQSKYCQYSIPLSKSFKKELGKLKSTPKEYDFLFIGRDAPNKNLNFFIDLASKNINKKFLAITSLQSKRILLPENLYIKSQLSVSDLLENIMKCHFLIVPSFYESFSKVCLEAIYAGLYVIGTDKIKGEEKFLKFDNYISLDKIEDLYDLSILEQRKKIDIEEIKNSIFFDEDYCFSKILFELRKSDGN